MKIYLKPTTVEINVNVEQMIAASKQPITTAGGDLNDAATTDQTSGNLSRRKDIWTDPEEEEEENF